MNLFELYDAIDGKYDEFVNRIQKEERAEKYLRSFLKEQRYSQLVEAVNNNDVEGAFKEVHTLKGMCANLALPKLYDGLNELTEALRNAKDVSLAKEVMGNMDSTYRNTIERIKEYLGDCI